MTVCFSCSSPVSSVAIIDGWQVLFEASEATSQNASGVCLRLLEHGLTKVGRVLQDASLFGADLGPGSFIGSRVGVTLAKTLAFAAGLQTVSASSFDLIDPSSVVAIPSKRAEFFIRRPGVEPYRTSDLPQEEKLVGYGGGIANPVYPSAARFASLLERLVPMPPERLMPQYLIEPSISMPKKPYGGIGC